MAREKRLEKRLGRGIVAMINQASQAIKDADQQVDGQDAFGSWTPQISAVDTQSPAVNSTPASANTAQQSTEQTDIIHYLDTNLIDANQFQPRIEFEEIEELGQSLNEYGLLQPVVVREEPNGRYELVAGERRLRAAMQIGWQRIPALIIDANDQASAKLSLVENDQRKNLNAIERAKALKTLMDCQGCTQEALAKDLCMDRSTVANLIRLLDLPQDLQDAILKNTISAAHGRALLPLKDAQLQREFMDRIVDEHLSAHQVEDMVREFLNNDEQENDQKNVIPFPQPEKSKQSAQLADLEKAMYSSMGMKVKLTQGTGGKGKMTISFKNHAQFERLQSVLMSGDFSDVIEKQRKSA